MSDKSKTSDKSKFDKSGEGENITLNFLIFSERVNDIFDVTIDNANNNRVFSLAKAIKTRRLDQFQDIDLTSLDLYKAEVMFDSVVIHSSSNSNALEIEGTIRMELQDKIYSHFFKQLQLKFSSEHY